MNEEQVDAFINNMKKIIQLNINKFLFIIFWAFIKAINKNKKKIYVNLKY